MRIVPPGLVTFRIVCVCEGDIVVYGRASPAPFPPPPPLKREIYLVYVVYTPHPLIPVQYIEGRTQIRLSVWFLLLFLSPAYFLFVSYSFFLSLTW